MLLYKGEILGKFENKFTDKETKKETITKKLQILEFDGERRNVVEIKLNEDENMEEYKKGVNVIIPIKIFTPNNSNNLFYSQAGKIQIQK